MLNSYIEFTAFGVYCDDFIDFLVSSNFDVSNISSQHGIYTVRVSPANYAAIARKARDFRVKTKVVFRSGVYFTLRRYRKRVGIPIGLLAFFGIIVLMSNFVWSIRVTGLCESSGVSRWQILEQLDLSGIRPGVHIHGFNANHAELELVLAIEGLAWVSIERTGSRINVKVSEVTDFSAGLVGGVPQIPVDTPCNVLANRSGQLIRAEVYRGQQMYEVGSGINVGDVIVSGVVNDNGRLSYVHADAKMMIEAVEIIDFFQPYTVFHRAKNGRSRSNHSIVFLGQRFGGEIDINKHADHVNYKETMTVPNLFGFVLPYRVLKQEYVFYDRVQVTDPPATALEKLNRQIELYEMNFLESAEIIEREVEYFPKDDGIGAAVRYVFHIDAAVKSEILVERY